MEWFGRAPALPARERARATVCARLFDHQLSILGGPLWVLGSLTQRYVKRHDTGCEPSRLPSELFDRMQRGSGAWKTLLVTLDRHAGDEFKLPLNEPRLRNSVGHQPRKIRPNRHGPK